MLGPMSNDREDPPPPPQSGLDPSSEVDIDLADDDEDDLKRATLPEGAEHLGDYPSIDAYLRAMLETEVSAGCQWILDHLDWRAVQSRWESDGSRLAIEQGQVYRLAASDPPGPFMPTRGS